MWLRGMWEKVGKPADYAGRALDFILSAAGRHGENWLVFMSSGLLSAEGCGKRE